MGMITIVGLGPGAVGHLSLETMSIMQGCEQVILRTAVHPTVAELAKQGVKYTSCDDLYEAGASFEEVYQNVVTRVLTAAHNGNYSSLHNIFHSFLNLHNLAPYLLQ